VRYAVLTACLSALFAVLPISRASAGPCPPSEWSFTTVSGWQTTTAAVFDTGAVGVRVSIDVPAGRLGVLRCCGLGITATRLIDAFDVTGVPPGTNVTAVAELAMDGMILGTGCGGSGCWGNLRGTISYGTQTLQRLLTAQVYGTDSVYVNATVTLPVTITAGTPLPISFMLEAYEAAGGSNGAHGTGTIRFTSLPTGVHVVSCKGYSSDVTPARTQSWGALKVLYR
jgi:hypothetical protein